MHIYMYELEYLLKLDMDNLKKVSFHADEANTDKPLKIYIKNFILNNFIKIPSNLLNKELTLNIDNKKILFSYKQFKDIFIENVFLQDALTIKEKNIIASSKNSVYTNPDLFLKLSDGIKTEYVTIELKSTKKDSIPGSSIQQINLNEWVIFVKHKEKNIDIITGQYINSINSKLQFPDRSPRPQVSFNELKSWNINNRFESGLNIIYKINTSDNKSKNMLILDWQNYLGKRWVEVIFSKETKTKEPWFNNALRKFMLIFLNDYEKMSESEKVSFKENVKKLIDN